jgi:hypothetical protein
MPAEAPAGAPGSEEDAMSPETREPRLSEEAVRGATGRGWDELFALLDGWGAAERTHAEIAAWLAEEQGVDGWWSQAVTVEYEIARGLRPRGGGRDGTYTVNASRTIAVPVERLFAAFADPELRGRWLPGERLRERTSRPPRTARFDWDDGATRLIVGFTAKGEAKSQVDLAHERLPDAEAAERARAEWRERLAALKALLEG